MTKTTTGTSVLTNVRLGQPSLNGSALSDSLDLVDVVTVDGVVAQVGPGLEHPPGSTVHELDGYVLMAAPAEPHAHLDKALTADIVHNPTGDLMGAITAWIAHRPSISHDDFVERATRAALMGLANGCTAIRTHIDIQADLGTRGVEALIEVKAALAGRVDLQLVGLVGRPSVGVDGAANAAALRRALDLGIDVVGGCPHLEPDGSASMRASLELAGEYGRPLDLHTDETLDPEVLDLEQLADMVSASGFDQPVVASHCVSLGVQSIDVQRRVSEKVAAAGIGVIALPQTNLFLQARGQRVSPGRGLTALASLREAGALVAAGADNLQDPFCTVGRADPLETAALMVMAGHDSPAVAYEAVSSASRRIMGLAPAGPAVGLVADLLAVRATTLREAVASAPADRVVFNAGMLVAGSGLG
ncbi:MAG: cytosine deaminase [Acidimicrobiales bacterium]|jgi:cytosine/creatinine deaminase